LSKARKRASAAGSILKGVVYEGVQELNSLRISTNAKGYSRSAIGDYE
jgi:hypothetical protein